MTFDLNPALTALVGRMQTNPSEFFEDTYRWDFLKREGIKEALTEDEIKLLMDGLVYVRRAEINNRILQGLLGEPEHEYEKVSYGQGLLQGTTTGFGQAAIKQESAFMRKQMEQLKYDVARQQNQQQYGSAPAPWQNTPSKYMKSFSK